MEIEIGIVLLGLVVGVLVGMTGMGGGALTTPALVFMFGIRPLVAVGTDIFFSLLLRILGSAAHLRLRTVDFSLVKYLAAGSIPGAILGIGALFWARETLDMTLVDQVVRQMVGVMLVLSSVLLIYRMMRGARPQEIASQQITDDFSNKRFQIALLGFGVGIAVTFTSIGSGSIVVAVLMLLIHLPAARIVGTDIVHGLPLLAIASMGHFAVGTINVSILASLLLGGVPGILVGSRLSITVPERGMRMVMATMLLAIGLRMI